MPSSDRLHALDAVRAFALLAGIALHAAHPYIEGLRGWVTTEAPSTALAGLWYTIHMFRMPLFFLIAGFFGRMMLERRGTAGFVKDRTRRILVPLVVGLPVVMLITGAAYFLGALATGADLGALQPPRPPTGVAERSVLAINLMHLWFLYYLVLFYVGTLVARLAAAKLLGRDGRFHRALDRIVGFALRGVWGPVVLALPIAVYYSSLDHWSSWGGLPAPFYLVPDVGALLPYGLFFGFGWLLHRQQHLLFALDKRWPVYGALAIGAWVVCRTIGGSTPHWGPYLQGGELLAYTTSYMVGMWCCSFALLGAAMRYLSNPSPVRRYLADSSYWLYLMHIAALFFFDQLLHPLPWHWSAKYLASIAASVLILLLSYHYLVRFTFIGAALNGRKAPRARCEVRQSAPGGLSRGTERRCS